MFASGVPNARADHLEAAVQAAIDMLAVIEQAAAEMRERTIEGVVVVEREREEEDEEEEEEDEDQP